MSNRNGWMWMGLMALVCAGAALAEETPQANAQVAVQAGREDLEIQFSDAKADTRWTLNVRSVKDDDYDVRTCCGDNKAGTLCAETKCRRPSQIKCDPKEAKGYCCALGTNCP